MTSLFPLPPAPSPTDSSLFVISRFSLYASPLPPTHSHAPPTWRKEVFTI